MDIRQVNLPKPVSGESLEEACKKAAKELGYKAKSHDRFSEKYTLGSVRRHQDYDRTEMRIGNLIPALRIDFIKKGKHQEYFFVEVGFPFYFASEERVQEYLIAVSKYL